MPRTALYLSSLALLLQASAALAQERLPVPDPRPEVETVGTGERRVAPDRATALLMVQSKAPTAAGAASENARVVQAVRDTLHQLGLTVATGSYNVGTDYGRDPRRATNLRAPSATWRARCFACNSPTSIRSDVRSTPVWRAAPRAFRV
jgi:Uncharacterized conserved protein